MRLLFVNERFLFASSQSCFFLSRPSARLSKHLPPYIIFVRLYIFHVRISSLSRRFLAMPFPTCLQHSSVRSFVQLSHGLVVSRARHRSCRIISISKIEKSRSTRRRETLSTCRRLVPRPSDATNELRLGVSRHLSSIADNERESAYHPASTIFRRRLRKRNN